MSKSGTSDGGHWKSKLKRRKPIDKEDLAVPWRPRGSRTARVWFDELPSKIIDGYKDLKTAFLANFMQQKKYVKDPVEIYNIKERDGETIEDFMKRFKGQPKRHVSEQRSDFRGQPREVRGSNGFTPLSKTPKEILAAKAGKFKPPPPMVTPVEKRSSNKFCDFHNDKGHNTDECVQLKKQIEELVQAGKLSHLIKEIKQGRDQPKVGKKEVPAKDKSTVIYMVQPWQRMIRQKVTQSFTHVREITFPPLATSRGTEGPLVIETEIGGHMIHRMYVDGGSSTEVLYEHCFNQLRPKIKSQMVLATTSLTSFSGETIWPLEQLRLLVTIGDAEHSTKAWMNFMIVRSLSPYNGIIGRPGIREIQAVPSTAHEMVKFPVDGGIVTIRSTILIPTECTTVTTASKEILKEAEVQHENFKSLNGKLASLKRFLSKSAEKSLPLFKTLKKCIKKSDFHWTPEAKQVFKQLKQHLSELPMLVAPKPKEELIGPELNNTPMEKLVLVLVFAAKRLRRYFQVHPIAVITEQPIKQIISRLDILADFLVEKPNEAPPDTSVVESPQEPWILFIDGSSCVDGSGPGLILTSPEGT
ncbi:reverse transcriptase domain-containing protein [Tanacetum coccineum]